AAGEAGARLRAGLAPLAVPLVQCTPQPRRRHLRHEVRRVTHLSTPFALSFAPLLLWPSLLLVHMLSRASLPLVSPAPAPLSFGLRTRQPNKADGQSCNQQCPNSNLPETWASSGL